MADGGLLLVYRSLTTDDLLARRQKYLDQMLNLGAYSSQTVGSKSFTRDLRELRSQLEAIQFVLNERTRKYEGTMITDFSQIGGPQGQPAGVTDQLSY